MNPRIACIVAVALVCPLVASADESRITATHGGVVLELGGGDARVEFVHDPKTGTVAVYGLSEPGRTLVWNDAPLLALATSWGPREIRLTSIDGQVNAWKATDTTLLKTDSISGQLRLRVDGVRFTAALGSTTPMQPASLRRTEGEHGGATYDIGAGAGRLEFVHDAPAGSVTMYVTPEPGTTPELTATPVFMLSTDAGPKSITFARVSGEAYVWKATNFDLLKTDQRLEGEVLLKMGGNSYTVPLSAPAPARSLVFERRYGLHGGPLFDVGNGTGRFELVHDPVLGTVTVYEVGAGPAFDDPPVFLLSPASGPRQVVFVRVEGSERVWRATDADYLKGPAPLDGRVRVRASGRTYTIAAAGDFTASDRGPSGGPIIVLGDGTRIEWIHDATLGTLTFREFSRPGATPVVFAEDPSVTLSSDPEPKETRLVLVEHTNAWRLVSNALKTDAVRGTLRVRVGSQKYEAPFETPITNTPRVDRPLVPETGVPAPIPSPGRVVVDDTPFGLVVSEPTPERRKELGLSSTVGVLVRSVRTGSDAEAYGLRPGDVIVSIDGHKATLASLDGLVAPLSKEKDKHLIDVYRGAKAMTLGR